MKQSLYGMYGNTLDKGLKRKGQFGQHVKIQIFLMKPDKHSHQILIPRCQNRSSVSGLELCYSCCIYKHMTKDINSKITI